MELENEGLPVLIESTMCFNLSPLPLQSQGPGVKGDREVNIAGNKEEADRSTEKTLFFHTDHMNVSHWEMEQK